MAAGWGLSAPEALVLMSLPHFDPRKAVKIGLFALLIQRILRLEVEERPALLWGKHKATRLRVAPDAPDVLPRPSASLVGVVRAAEPGSEMSDVVKQATRAYGRALTGFVSDCVVPELVGRGLAEKRRRKLLGLLPLTRFYPTASGEAERRRLEGAMREARSIPDLLDRDPAQAAALAVAAGSAILLVDGLRPHYRAIAQALRDPDTDGSSGAFDRGGEGSGADPISLDTATGAFGFDLGACDFSAFDSFDAGFDAFDAGFDSAAGDGGSDGGGDGGSDGGGDGGSSSC